ncbi:N-acetylmuramoyl-L-alanine amidase family protein [Pseudobutyrivibrio sp.]|uniref:N-acetylmuramoyl-L-alanine amidase family protein n=1 Tax=Pseudobutyrivibrio sp. TaxID=2014367 RepID=UPI001D704147|nr:N-acetylmuramoyl-L-alanine amidase [Pseudobutyrivibrio sp.]MBE5912184.1 N-acetylmuramoyl-L-alanine amidase [Pseudobutyrivibrio sp.]
MRKTTRGAKKYLVVMLLLCLWVTNINIVMAKESSTPKVIVIDPAFQENTDDTREPVGPGAFTTCESTSTGNTGVSTGYPEYELTLQVSLKLQNQLEESGYTVLLTRTTNDVDITNSGRAMIANMADADLFIVVSANDSKAAGVEVVCQSDDNPYNYGNYSDGRLLSDAILGSMKSNCAGNEVVEDDERAVMNWCQSPSTVVEVGSLENEDDEAKLVTDEYQETLAQGIAAGVDSYFAQR